MKATRTVAERLAARLVRMSNGCLEWTGAASSPSGYGVIGRGTRGQGWTSTHRLAWELANGPIPPGLDVCHHCDNPPCCDVEHLFLGTRAENMADMMAKGRRIYEPVTQCKYGHPFDEANTYTYLFAGRPHRACLACRRERYRSRKDTL